MQAKANPSTASPPPILEGSAPAGAARRRRRLALHQGCLVLALLILGIFTLRFAQVHDLPLPGCSFQSLTGAPCAFCGSCRGLAALGAGDLGEAWRLNPLATLGALAAALWGGVRIWDGLVGSRWTARIGQWVRHLPWPRLVAAIVLLNWFYLLVKVK